LGAHDKPVPVVTGVTAAKDHESDYDHADYYADGRDEKPLAAFHKKLRRSQQWGTSGTVRRSYGDY
jgi:hypothetical protein